MEVQTRTSTHSVTQLLREVSAGRPDAIDEVLPLVYDKLKLLASGRLKREYAGSTLATTGLVHEAYLKLVRGADGVDWQDRGHFFAIASRAMRQVLVSRAIARKAQKRGAAAEHVEIDDRVHMSAERADELIALDEALEQLQKTDPRAAQIVDLRYFGGFTVAECADLLGLSEATVNRDWRAARLLLFDLVKSGTD